MARVHAANASAHSIRGLARSLTHPNYRRLVDAEPLLRRVVPFLIIAFIVTVVIGASVQIIEHRREAIADARNAIAMYSLAAGEELSRVLAAKEAPTETEKALRIAIPALATQSGRQFLVTDPGGKIIAAEPANPALLGKTLLQLFGPSQALTTFAERAGVVELEVSGGMTVYATVRNLRDGTGQIAIVQPRANALQGWWRDTRLTVTLVSTTSVVLLMLGFAFHWQSSRAREADQIYDRVRERIDTALSRGHAGLWDWDLARGHIFWSDSMFEILGFKPRDELLSFGEIDALVHPDDGSLFELASNLADAMDGAVDRAFRMRHANGSWVWLRARAELIHETAGKGPHLIGIAVDITEEKRLQVRTATSDMRLREAVDTISQAFVLWDADNRLVLSNAKFQEQHGLTESALEPGTSYDAIAKAMKNPVVQDSISQSDHGTSAQLTDGRWVQINERRMKDGGLVSIGVDITNIKQHEEKLVESERNLIAKNADLRNSQQTLEYQAQQLAELAQKYSDEKTRAEEASQAKSEFLANMSHELRTPLNAIIGFSEIMESGMFGSLGSEKYHEYCRDIRESGRYLLDVINDILDMAKIEAGRMPFELESVRLEDIVPEAMRVMSVKANEKRLACRTEISEGLMLRADRRAVKQILLNLVSNAIKFTPDGGHIRVTARSSGKAAFIVIEDSGIGIPRDALRRLGRPFEQVESQLTKTQAGSGLGLAIAKSLTELHGGRMRIRSIENVGTTVFLRMPAADAA
ncbi:MAG TPA: ATP-binding protein [Xanthobacteraceae bacterium]|nr:ATP-binding protein [Xanthobacteraceae bacterium]